MEDLTTVRTLVTLGGVFASLAGAWVLMTYKQGELRKDAEEQGKSLKALGKKYDITNNELSLLAQKQAVIGGMLSPEALAVHTKAMTKLETHTEYLRRDVDALRTKDT